MSRRSVLFLSALTTLCAAHRAEAAPVRWHQTSVEVVVDASLESAGLQGTSAALQAGIAWASVSSSIPDLVLTTGSTGKVGYTPGGKNESSIRFAPNGSPEAKGALAVTVRTYNTRTGALLDADIVINGEHKFRKLLGVAEQKKNAPNAYDLQNTLTHELGHFLGLGEDFDHEHATMYAYTQPGEVKKRVPGGEDVNQLLSLYDGSPEEAASGAQGCGIAPGRTRASSNFLFLSLGMFAFVAGSRRRKRRTLSLVLAGGVLLFALPGLADSPLQRGDSVFQAQLKVSTIDARFEGGLIVSTMGLVAERCDGDCSGIPLSVTVYGGAVGDIGQVVGHSATPEVGERVVMRASHRADTERVIEVAPLSVAAAQKKARSSKW